MTIFSDSTPRILSEPRPPDPIIARLSLLFRFRPRIIAGAENVTIPAAAVWLRNCRRDNPSLALFALAFFLRICGVSQNQNLNGMWNGGIIHEKCVTTNIGAVNNKILP